MPIFWGWRYRFGEDATRKTPCRRSVMAPAKVPDRRRSPRSGRASLPRPLEQAAMGGGAPSFFPEAG